ncbi:hypothetical protein [Sporocytophaga myxococcoides]|uniref:hypothetical protein n=1 Tax=Sporocytophaga myxococcoides TaxID=153721 RepID=UPI0003F8971C|nr:hypothetical protein [Sporocytophaga myxococcoides]
MNRFFPLIFFFVASFLITGCSSEQDPDVSDYQYFPIEKGMYVLYSVDKKTYGVSDSTHSFYYLKEIIGDTFRAGDEVKYRVERYTKKSLTEPWPAQPDSVWSEFNSKNNVTRMENNIRFIKMTFPLENDKTWDGNAENTLGQEFYKVKDLKRTFYVDTIYFPNSVKIIQADNQNLIEKKYKVEYYAKHVGLIYKEKRIYEYDQSPSAIGKYVIKTGETFVQKIYAYGKE